MNRLITDFEEIFDENPKASMMEFLRDRNPTFNDLHSIRNVYNKCYVEVISNDDQVVEAYGDKLPFWQDVYNSIVEDIDNYAWNLTKVSCDEY